MTHIMNAKPLSYLRIALRSVRFYWRTGQIKQATDSLWATLSALRNDPWPAPQVVAAALEATRDMCRGDVRLAERVCRSLGEPFALRLLDADRKRTRVQVASVLDPQTQAEAFEDLEPHVPWERKFLAMRLEAYRASSHPLAGRAEREFLQYLQTAHTTFRESLRWHTRAGDGVGHQMAGSIDAPSMTYTRNAPTRPSTTARIATIRRYVPGVRAAEIID